jgi:AcrR family transcriptional regulator
MSGYLATLSRNCTRAVGFGMAARITSITTLAAPLWLLGGRPKQGQTLTTDRAVLATARACFLAKGFQGTTIEGVAGQAGVTKVTVYLRQKDKTALFRAVLAERMLQWGAASRRAAWIKGNTLESRFKHQATAVLRAIRNPEVRAFIKLVDGCRGLLGSDSARVPRHTSCKHAAPAERRHPAHVARYGRWRDRLPLGD